MSPKEEQILIAAEKLFAQKGFSATSTREISKAAGANISLISYYFGSKEKMYERIFEIRLGEGYSFASEIQKDKNINSWEKLCIVIDKYVDRVKNLKDFYAIMQREQLNNKNTYIFEFTRSTKKNFLDIYKKLVTIGIKEGLFKKKTDVTFLHSMITGTLFASVNNQQLYKEHMSIKDENTYYQNIKSNLKEILKHLLGYEENI